ncbi:MAG: Gfo/Idh/MocA family oxidoreductase [Bacteroidota bacterium]
MPHSRRKFIRQAAVSTAAFSIIPAFVRAGAVGTRPSDKLNLGFIGCGKQSAGLGNRFVEQTGAQIVAACDVYTKKLEWFVSEKNAAYAEQRDQSSYDGLTAYTDYRALLDHPGLDGVIIATPDHWHATMCVAALDKGLHVYCEKPLAHTLQEGRAIVDACERNGKILQTGSMQRSWRDFRHAVELIRNGHLGEIQEAIVAIGPPPKKFDLDTETLPGGLDWENWVGPALNKGFNHVLAPATREEMWPKWRDYAEYGGGLITDWGAHMFDIVQWALDMDESGPVEFLPPPNRGDTIGASFRYDNGIRVVHEDFGRGFAVRFVGSEGTLDVSRSFLDSSIPGLVDRAIGIGEERVYHSAGHEVDFLQAVKNNTQPICPAETGHRSASVCTLLNICYRLQRSLRWNPKKEKFRGDRAANKLRGDEYRLGV